MCARAVRTRVGSAIEIAVGHPRCAPYVGALEEGLYAANLRTVSLQHL